MKKVLKAVALMGMSVVLTVTSIAGASISAAASDFDDIIVESVDEASFEDSEDFEEFEDEVEIVEDNSSEEISNDDFSESSDDEIVVEESAEEASSEDTIVDAENSDTDDEVTVTDDIDKNALDKPNLDAKAFFSSVLNISLDEVQAVNPKAASTSGKTGEAVRWKYDSSSKTLTFTGSGDMDNYSDVASKAAPWVSFPVTSVVFEDGITGIGDYSFYNMATIKSLKLPKNLKRVGDGAFYNCPGLRGELILPNSLTDIGVYAFVNNGFSKVDTGDGIRTIGAGAFAIKNVEEFIIGKNVEYIFSSAIALYNVRRTCFRGNRPKAGEAAVYIDDYNYVASVYYPKKDSSWDGIEFRDLFETWYGNVKYRMMRWDGIKVNPDAYVKVVFDGVSESFGGTQYIMKNDADDRAIMPEPPTKYKQQFIGWYEENAKEPFDFSKALSKDVTVYPQYGTNHPEGIHIVYDDMSRDGFSYTGKPITLKGLEVYDGNQFIYQKENYTVSYKNNTNAGTAQVIIKFNNKKYSGKKVFEFKILPIDMNLYNSTYYVPESTGASGEYIKVVPFDNKVHKIPIKVKDTNHNKYLKAGTDYEVIYPGTDKKSTEYAYDPDAFKAPGKYSVIVRGKNNYKGTVIYGFEIVEKTPITKCSFKLPSSLSVTRLSELGDFAVLYGGKELVIDEDYVCQTRINLYKSYAEVKYEAKAGSGLVGDVVKTVKLTGKSTKSLYVCYDEKDKFRLFRNAKEGKVAEKFFTMQIRRRLEPGIKCYHPYDDLEDKQHLPGEVTEYFAKKSHLIYSSEYYYDDIEPVVTPPNGLPQEFVGGRELKRYYIKVSDLSIEVKKDAPLLKYTGSTIKFARSKSEAQKTGTPYYGDYITVKAKGKTVPDYYWDYKELDIPNGYFVASLYMSERKGKATLTVEAKTTDNSNGPLYGKKTINYPINKIEKIDFSKDCKLVFSNDSNRPQNGSEAKSYVVLFCNSEDGVDYDLRKSCLKPGCSVYFWDEYAGRFVYLYDSSFSCKYINCSKTGTASILITGKGFFQGTFKGDYEIRPYDISKTSAVRVRCSDVVYKNSAGAWKKEPKVTLWYDTKLKKGTDYEIARYYYYSVPKEGVKRLNKSTKKTETVYVKAGDEVNALDIVPVGTRIGVEICGKGFYAGKAKNYYSIVNKKK